MPRALLIVDDTNHSPELRHELGVAADDPVVWVALGDRRLLWCSRLDVDLLGREAHVDDANTWESVGRREVVADRGLASHLLTAEYARRALERVGVNEVAVPAGMPVAVADHLRASGVAVTVDDDEFTLRRRAKSEAELAGMRAAARATHAAMLAAAALIRERGDDLRCEEVRERMHAVLLDEGADTDEILVHSGDAALRGHDPGTGPVARDTSLIVDCFPRHRASGMHYDCTRTWVVGTPLPELRRYWQDCLDALELAYARAAPGVDDLHARVAEFFVERGHEASVPGADTPETGFIHGLGHGVGLEVHEAPHVGQRSEPLIAGDTIAVEPGLYAPGVGGVRLEDTILITETGMEQLIEPLPYGLELPAR